MELKIQMAPCDQTRWHREEFRDIKEMSLELSQERKLIKIMEILQLLKRPQLVVGYSHLGM